MVERSRTRKPNHKWSDYESKYLLENFDKMTYRAIGEHLGIKEESIKNQAYKLKLKKTNQIFKDYSGIRKGYVICLERDKEDSSLFHCLCEKCNTKMIIPISFLSTSRNKKYNLTSYCNCKTEKREKIQWKGCGEIPGWLYGKIRKNAKGRGLEFNVSVEYLHEIWIKQNKKCPYSGIEITFTRIEEEFKYKTASLDRIDSSKGYIEGNVQWTTKQVNFMKQNLSDEDFLNLVTKIYENTRGKNNDK